MMVKEKLTFDEKIRLYNQVGAVSNYFSKIRLTQPKILSKDNESSTIRIPKFRRNRIRYENPLVIGVFQSILIDFLPYLIAYVLVFKSVNESVIRTYESKRFILFDFSSALDSMPDLRRIIKEKQK